MGYSPNHKRIKQDINADPVVIFHKERIGQMSCMMGGGPISGPHHIMHLSCKAKRRDDRYIVPLSDEYHTQAKYSVHLLGSEAKFLEVHGVDLKKWALDEWLESQFLYSEIPW